MEALLNVSLPVFGIVLAGFLAGRFGLLGDAATEALSKFVFYVALPPLLFLAMARAPLEQIFDWHFIGAYALGQAATFLIALTVARTFFGLSLAPASLFGMAGIFGNTGYMGIPLAISAFGDWAALPAIISTVINSAIVITVIVALIEAERSEKASVLGIAFDVGGAMLRNPLLVGPVLGMAVSILGLPLPEPVVRFCELIGASAGPCALFSIGLFLVGKPVSTGLTEVSAMVVLKLILQPLLTFLLFLFVFPAEAGWIAVGVVMAALPAGANVFVLAQRYGVYIQRSSSVILLSTLLSVATVSALLAYFHDV
jgi:predicted permease